MPTTLKGLNNTWNSDTYMAIHDAGFPVATLGAGLSSQNSIQGPPIFLPYNFKIRRVSVFFMAIDTLAGTDLFNITVLAPPGVSNSYTPGNVAANDNSEINLNPPGVFPVGGTGFPTNFATATQSVFAADVPITLANFPNATTAYGGWAIFTPSSPDAVYSAMTPLGLRVTTTTSTGAINSLVVRLSIVAIPLRKSEAVGQAVYPAPGLDY